GLFSNEAGQGSAPIAHAAARAHEPVSEGLVALLEPFIDTTIICSLTGLVLLSSGVWTEKIENRFQDADIMVLQGTFSQDNEQEVEELHQFLIGNTSIPAYTGSVEVIKGEMVNPPAILHSRSLAED